MKAKTRTKMSRSQRFAAGVGRALRRAAKDARKTARMYGTPLYVWEDGKAVGKKPGGVAVPGMSRTQIGCASNLLWCACEEGWQALQVVEF